MPKPKPRLTRAQYLALETQYQRTPPLSDGVSASGEQYQLAYLLNRFGFHPNSREQAMELTKELLAEGWIE
jgi:fructosamine-3-kinase